MEYFKVLVKDEGVSPSEVWGLDLEMTKILLSDKIQEPMDLTIMLNAERQMNGAPKEILNYGN